MPFLPTIPTVCATCRASFLAPKPARTRPPAKYCSLRCAKRALQNTPETFWARVQRGPGCWTWTGRRTAFGYGELQMAGRHVTAHRLAWELTYGSIPDGQSVLHSCDNPPCCRPTHLWLGSQADNLHDMFRKGRRH